MGMRLLAFCLTLLLLALVRVPGDVWFSGSPSAAQAATPLTPDEVYRKCRKSVFRQHGRRDSRHPGKLLVASHSATQMVDECVRRER
jgi:hypothetical protein